MPDSFGRQRPLEGRPSRRRRKQPGERDLDRGSKRRLEPAQKLFVCACRGIRVACDKSARDAWCHKSLRSFYHRIILQIEAHMDLTPHPSSISWHPISSRSQSSNHHQIIKLQKAILFAKMNCPQCGYNHISKPFPFTCHCGAQVPGSQ